MILLLVIVLSVCVLVYMFGGRNASYWAERNVPSVPGTWLLGNYKDVLTSARHIGLLFQDMYNAFPGARYVGYLKIRQPCVLLRDPDLIRTAFTTDFSSFANNEIYVDKEVDFLFGNNPFVLRGEEWKRSRSHFVPTLSGAKLKTYFPTLLPVCDTMVRYIEAHVGEGGVAELETKHLFGLYTTDAVANAVFGLAVDSFADEDNAFSRITKSFFDGSMVDHLKITALLFFPQLAKFLRIRFVNKECQSTLLQLTRRIIKQRRETGETRNDFFQQMIAYRENDTLGVFTDKYIASHSFGFVVDGYETSSDVITFTMFELAWHEDVQDRLREEINGMFEETNGEMRYENISNLKYLDMVVSESLRMHPPALLISRVCTAASYRLPAAREGARGGAAVEVELARDTPVSVPVYALHMDPQHFPAPHRFDPERFTEEAVAARHKFAYLPFGEGPRMCLGMKFGLMQVKTALVATLRRFRVKPSSRSGYPVGIDPKIIIKRPLGGAWVYFQKL